MNQHPHGRTWADLFAENVWLIRWLLIVLILILIVLTASIFTGHNVTKDGVTMPTNHPVVTDTVKKEKVPQLIHDTIREPAKEVIKYVDRPIVLKETIREKPTEVVQSVGQSGGITAKEVNFGKPIPKLQDPMKQSILNMCQNKHEKIRITYQPGPAGSMEYAYKIKEFMEQSGYTALDFGIQMTSGVKKGVSYTPAKNNQPTTIHVGVLD